MVVCKQLGILNVIEAMELAPELVYPLYVTASIDWYILIFPLYIILISVELVFFIFDMVLNIWICICLLLNLVKSLSLSEERSF